MTHYSRLETLSDILLAEDRFREPGLHSPMLDVFEPERWDVQPKVVATIVGNRDLKLEFPGIQDWRGTSRLSAMSLQDQVWPQAKMANVKHDYTAGYLARSLDRPLKTFFKQLHDHNDDLTPDVIHEKDGVVFVHEFATVNIADVGRSKEAHQQKHLKYDSALAVRAKAENKPVVFTVTVIGPRHVVSDLPLSEEDVTELCLRMLIGRQIEYTLVSQGVISSPSEKEENDRIQAARVAFSQIPHDWERLNSKFPSCSKAVYDACMEPPNMKYITEQLQSASIKSRQKLRQEHFLGEGHPTSVGDRLKLNLEECVSKIDEYINLNEPPEAQTKHNTKSVIQIPWWVPERGTGSNTLSLLRDGEREFLPEIGESKEDTFQCWKSAWEYAREHPEYMVEESIEAEVARAMLETPAEEMELSPEQAKHAEAVRLKTAGVLEKTEVSMKSRYRRVNYKVSASVAQDLAKRGIEGKKHRDDPEVKAHKAQKKKPMSYSTETKDLDKLLQKSQEIFTKTFSFTGKSYDEHMLPDLAGYAYNLHGQGIGDPWKEFLKKFLGCHLGKWCSFVSDLATELAISMRQHCKEGQMILKKLRHFDIFVLIKPTNSGSCVYYSLLTFKEGLSTEPEGAGTVFKQDFENHHVRWTEFGSANASKLLNLVKCKSTVFTLLSYWMEFYGVQFWAQDLSEESTAMGEVWKMVTVCLMVLLEDKSKSEEIITVSRFVFMEGLVAQPALPKPHKVLGKLPVALRSRLQVWLVKKTLEAMKRISLRPFSLSSDDRRPKWSGMFNMFTGTEVEEPMQMISLFYVGYLKNKDESPQGNTSGALYDKVMEYESRRPNSDDNLGLGDPTLDEVAFHEFSRSFLAYCVDLSKAKLQKMWGEKVEDMISNDILESLGGYSLEQLGTLKASSTYDKSMYDYDPKRSYHRKKVIEFTSEKATEHTHVHEIVKESLEAVEENGCLHIDLFKKAQHGGLREIYVLGPNERVIQLCIELIARAICRRFPSETMMTPANKFKLPQQHNKNARKNCGRNFTTTSTSDDASKWNQGHYVSKFAMMLCRFTDKLLHPFIMRACALFTNKVIKIDDQLLKLFAKYDEDIFSSEHVRKMHAAFRGGLVDADYVHVGPGKTYLRTSTGMLQGILHYTSSLLHTILQELMKEVIEGRFKRHLPLLKKSTLRPYVTVMQSSDDSSIMISFPTDPDRPELTCQGYIVSWEAFQMKKELGLLLGIYPSEKCTTNTPWVTEFNSEFFFMSDLIRPLFRWVAAVNSLSEHETLAGRQEEMASNLSNILGGGGTTSLAANCQLSQMMLHYQVLGSGVSQIFSRYVRVLEQDPSVGFFLLDHPFMAGLCGFKYNLFRAVKCTKLGDKYKKVLETQESVSSHRKEAGLSSKTLVTTKAGSIVDSTIVSMSTRRRWQKLVNGMNFPDDWREQIKNNQEVLYEKARTPEELRLKLAAFMHSPGVVSSLGHSGAVVRVLASSAYCLSHPVVQDRTDWYCSLESKKTKTSLFALACDEAATEPADEPITNDQLLALFPQKEDFEDLERVGDNFTRIAGSSVTRNRPRVTTRVTVTGVSVGSTFSLLDVARFVWFGTSRMHASPGHMMGLWSGFKERIPWLKDTPHETLDASPFVDAQSLHNFIAGDPVKGRVVAMSGVPVKRTFGISNLYTMVAENFAPLFRLTNSIDLEARGRSEDFIDLRHILALISQSFLNDASKVEQARQVLKSAGTIDVDSGAARTRRNCLAVIQDFAKHGDVERTKSLIFSHKLGCLGGYSVRQFFISEEEVEEGQMSGYFGRGIWRGFYDTTGIEIHIDRKQKDPTSYITGVVVSDTRDLNNVFRFLKEWSKENDVNNLIHYSQKSHLTGRQVARMHNYGLCLGQRGVPIVVNERLTSHLHSEEFARVELTMSHGSLRLVGVPTFSAGKRKEVTLLSYTCRTSDIDVLRRGVATKLKLKSHTISSYVRAWLDCEPLSGTQFVTLLNRIKNERGTGVEPKHDWLHRKEGLVVWPKLEARLRELGEIQLRYSGVLKLGKSPGEPAPAENLDVSEEFDPLYFDSFFSDDVGKDMEVMLDVLEVTKAVDEDGTLMEEKDMFWDMTEEEGDFGFDLIRQLELQEAREEVRISHPYMRTAIDNVLEALGGSERAIRAILNRSVPKGVPDFAVDALILIFNWWGLRVERPDEPVSSDVEEELGDDIDLL
nr:MAG: L protein [Phenuiviridae sp.]